MATTLDKLILCPLLDGYSLGLGNDVITTHTESGMPRQRLEAYGRPHKINLGFRHKAHTHAYFMSFWRQHKTKPFALRLLADTTELSWYECRFLDVPQLRPLGAGLFEVGLSVVCKPQPLAAEQDQSIIDLYTATGGNTEAWFNALEKLVNEDLPNAL